MGPNGVLLGVFHQVGFILWTNVAAVLVNIVLAVALVSAAGALGAAIAMAATQVLLNAVRQVGVARRTPVRALDRAYLRIYAPAVASVIGLFLLNLLFSPPLAVGLVLVVAAWAAVLFVARRQLAFAQTFPELSRLPGVSRLFEGRGRRP
jgi:O-antigen/teichoic acid export membrane protein